MSALPEEIRLTLNDPPTHTASQALREPRMHIANAARDHRQVSGGVFELGVRAGNCADKPAAVPERHEAIIAAVPYLDRDRNGSHLETPRCVEQRYVVGDPAATDPQPC